MSDQTITISRFIADTKLSEIPASVQHQAKRTLLRVSILEAEQLATADAVERLMGSKPEARFAFIQERAPQAGELVDI